MKKYMLIVLAVAGLTLAPVAARAGGSGATVVVHAVGSGAPVHVSPNGHRARFAGGQWLDSSLSETLGSAPAEFSVGARFRTMGARGGIVSFRGYSLWITDGRLLGSGPAGVRPPHGTWHLVPLVGPTVSDGAWHHARIVGAGTRVKLRLDGAVVATMPYFPVSGGDAFWVGWPTTQPYVGTIAQVSYGPAGQRQKVVFQR